MHIDKGQVIKKDEYIRLYSLVFGIVCILTVVYLIKSGVTFVRNGDALTQHYPAFIYIGQYYRDAFKTLIMEHRLPSTWDFSIGYGSDVITTLTYYGLTDWSTVIFAVFSNGENGPVLYTVMMMARTFLAGLFFAIYCRRMKGHPVGSVIAAMAYILSPYMLENVFNGHHFMALPVMYMPLLLIIIEDFIDNKGRPVLYCVIIALAALSSYYYFFMEMVFAVVYYLCRFPYKERGIKEMLRTGIRISVFTILGGMLAAPILLPIIYSLSSDARITANLMIPLLYGVDEYKEVFGNLIGSNAFSYYSYMGVSPFLLVGIPVLFTNKKMRWLQILFFIATISCLLPFTGYFMNGLSYVANRHVWIYIFIVSLIFAIELNDFFTLNKRQKTVLCVSVMVYIVLLALFPYSSKFEMRIATVILLVAVVLTLIPASTKTISIIISIMVALGIGVHVHSIFVTRGGKDKFLSKEYIDEYNYNEFGEAFERLKEDDSLWRLDWNYGSKKPNSLNENNGSTYSYWSFQNPYITQYLYENGVLNFSFEHDGVDNRHFLQRALGCKYVVSNDPITIDGYKLIDEERKIYLNENYYPIARAYNRVAETSRYLDATFGEKQILESIACINSDPDVLNLFETIGQDWQNQVEFSIDSVNNLIGDNEIIINDVEEPLLINVEKCLLEGELFVEIYDLQYENDNKIDGLRIFAESDNSRCSRNYYSQKDKLYSGFRNFNLCLKTEDADNCAIKLYFSEPGMYHFKALVIENIPNSVFYDSQDVENILEPALTNKGLEVSAEFDNDRILYFSVPYSSGWNAKMDENSVEIFRANIMGVAMIVPPGNHNIVLYYRTPGLGFGIMLAFIGVILIVVTSFKWKSK